ncbi:MAG: TolC family protein [Thermodesulfobacteriota bacterium]
MRARQRMVLVSQAGQAPCSNKGGRFPAAVAVALLLAVLLSLANPAASTAASMQQSLPEAWTLREAVRFALANSPDSKAGLARIEAARAGVTAERSAFLPQLSVQSRYGQTNNPMYSFGNILNQGAFHPGIDFNSPGRTDALSLGVRIGYRLFNGWQDIAGLDGAKAREEASRMELASVHSQLAFEVVRGFNAIRQAEGMVRAQEEAVKSAEAAAKVAKARHDEGVLLRSELLDLEVRQAASREALLQARHGLALAQRVFANLLGLEAGAMRIDTVVNDQPATPPVETPVHRPELEGVDAMIRVAQARVRQANATLFPEVEGYAGYNTEKGFELDSSGDSWEAGVMLRYPLFDGGRSSAMRSTARAGLAEAQEQRRKLALAIGLEVEQARLGQLDAKERLAVTAGVVEQAGESARITRERFKEGQVKAADLIGVEARLTEAKVRRIMAESADAIATAEMRRSLGLPQFEESAPSAGQ